MGPQRCCVQLQMAACRRLAGAGAAAELLPGREPLVPAEEGREGAAQLQPAAAGRQLPPVQLARRGRAPRQPGGGTARHSCAGPRVAAAAPGRGASHLVLPPPGHRCLQPPLHAVAATEPGWGWQLREAPQAGPGAGWRVQAGSVVAAAACRPSCRALLPLRCCHQAAAAAVGTPPLPLPLRRAAPRPRGSRRQEGRRCGTDCRPGTLRHVVPGGPCVLLLCQPCWYHGCGSCACAAGGCRAPGCDASGRLPSCDARGWPNSGGAAALVAGAGAAVTPAGRCCCGRGGACCAFGLRSALCCSCQTQLGGPPKPSTGANQLGDGLCATTRFTGSGGAAACAATGVGARAADEDGRDAADGMHAQAAAPLTLPRVPGRALGCAALLRAPLPLLTAAPGGGGGAACLAAMRSLL